MVDVDSEPIRNVRKRSESPVPLPVWPKPLMRGHVASQVEKLQQSIKQSSSIKSPMRTRIMTSDPNIITSFPKSSPKVIVKHDPQFVSQVKIRDIETENGGKLGKENLSYIQEEEEDEKSVKSTTSSCCEASLTMDEKYVQAIQISAMEKPKSPPVKKLSRNVPRDDLEDSIVTEALLQFTDTVRNSNSPTNSGSFAELDNTNGINFPDLKKKEDMDKVIRELTNAVMKSKNVTTLTRAMQNKEHGKNGSLSSSSSKGAGSRRNNRLRNSIRTLRSISRGSKGIEVMKSLWQQTGMKTNGRKLLVDSLSEGSDSSSDGKPSSPPYRSVLVVSRTTSSGSTTATYAEVYHGPNSGISKGDGESSSSSDDSSTKRKTVQFRESSRKPSHLKNPKFVYDQKVPVRSLSKENLSLNGDPLILNAQSLTEEAKGRNRNHWETYYGITNELRNDINKKRQVQQSLYNTPYYDYRREQSKVCYLIIRINITAI